MMRKVLHAIHTPCYLCRFAEQHLSPPVSIHLLSHRKL